MPHLTDILNKVFKWCENKVTFTGLRNTVDSILPQNRAVLLPGGLVACVASSGMPLACHTWPVTTCQKNRSPELFMPYTYTPAWATKNKRVWRKRRITSLWWWNDFMKETDPHKLCWWPPLSWYEHWAWPLWSRSLMTSPPPPPGVWRHCTPSRHPRRGTTPGSH